MSGHMKTKGRELVVEGTRWWGLGQRDGAKGKGPTKQTMFESAIIKQNNVYAN